MYESSGYEVGTLQCQYETSLDTPTNAKSSVHACPGHLVDGSQNMQARENNNVMLHGTASDNSDLKARLKLSKAQSMVNLHSCPPGNLDPILNL